MVRTEDSRSRGREFESGRRFTGCKIAAMLFERKTGKNKRGQMGQTAYDKREKERGRGGEREKERKREGKREKERREDREREKGRESKREREKEGEERKDK